MGSVHSEYAATVLVGEHLAGVELAAVQTNNVVLSDAVQRLVALGLLAPVAGGAFRGVSALVDTAKPAPDVPAPATVVPVPVPSAKKKPAIKFAQGKPVPTDGLHPFGCRSTGPTPPSLSRSSPATRPTRRGPPPGSPRAAAALTAGGLYGGYRLVDSLVNKKRKADLTSEVDEAKQDFLRELSQGYKTAGHDADASPLWKLAAARCSQLAEKRALDERAQPAEYQTASNIGGIGAGAGATALLALLGTGGVRGYRYATQNDPARVAKRRAERQIAEQWATAPPEVVAVPS